MGTNPEKVVREGCLMFELRADVYDYNPFCFGFRNSDCIIIISLRL